MYSLMHLRLSMSLFSPILQDKLLGLAVQKFNEKNWKKIGEYDTVLLICSLLSLSLSLSQLLIICDLL